MTDTMANIVHREPDWTLLPPSTPAAVRRLLKACVVKDAAAPVEEHQRCANEPVSRRRSGDGAARAPRRSSQARWFGITAAVLARGCCRARAGRVGPRPVATSGGVDHPPGGAAAARQRVLVRLRARDIRGVTRRHPDRLCRHRSPGDADLVAASDQSRLHGRSKAPSARARSCGLRPATRSPFSSTTSSSGSDLNGGVPVVVCDAQSGVGLTGSWGATNEIVFASIEGEAIYRVSAGGGAPTPIVRPDSERGEARVFWPSLLPDGRRVMFITRFRDGTGQLSIGGDGRPPRHVAAMTSSRALDRSRLPGLRAGGVTRGPRVRSGSGAFHWRANSDRRTGRALRVHLQGRILRIAERDLCLPALVRHRPSGLDRPVRRRGWHDQRTRLVSNATALSRRLEARDRSHRSAHRRARPLGDGSGPWHRRSRDVRTDVRGIPGVE